jgi:hypothetical protein
MEIRRSVRGTESTVVALALALAVAAACSDTRGPTAPTAGTNTQAFRLASSGAAPTFLQDDPQVGPEIAAIRAATVQFHDVNAAIAAGYRDPAGRLCEQNSQGAMGIHSPNLGLLATQEIDPLRPEVLLYLPKPEGGYRLVGVEYVQYIIVTAPDGSFSGPWTSPTQYPPNYLESAVPELFGHPFLGPVAPHPLPGMAWHRELHAWVWANNPTGMFEPWNPAISCN